MKRGVLESRWLLTGVAAMAIAATTGPASAGQRPLSDFISRQGAWCAAVDDAGIDCLASHYGGPASCGPDELTFTFPLFWGDPKSGITAGIDMLGQVSDGDPATAVDGSVAESSLPNGRADVKVVLQSSNARAIAFDADGEGLFGPAPGEAMAQVKFTNTAPGAPLPDFFQMLFCPAPGQALEFLSMHARASGSLQAPFGVPDGTPGRLEVTQTGLIGTSTLVDPHSRVAVDAFPAEKVILHATGH